MSKKLLISIASLLVIGGLGYFVYSKYFGKEDLSRYVPKSAVFVLKIDLMSMGQKANFSKISELKMYKDLVKMIPGNQKKMMEDFFKNPNKASGLSFTQAPYLFVNNIDTSKDRFYYGWVMGVSDRKKLSDYLKLSLGSFGNITEKGSFTIIAEQGGNYMFISDKVLFFLGSKDANRDKMIDLAESLLKLNPDGTIASDENFKNLTKLGKDFTLSLNKKSIKELALQNSGSFYDKLLVGQTIDVLPSGMTLDFEEDAIRAKIYLDKDSKDLFAKNYKNTGLSEEDQKLISPDGKPVMYLAANLELKNAFSELAKTEDYQNLLTELSMSDEDFKSMFAGNISFAINSIQMKESTEMVYPDYLDDDTEPRSETIKKPYPIFALHVGLGKPEVFDKLIQAVLSKEESQLVDEGNGMYSIAEDIEGNNSIYIIKKDKHLLISNNRDQIQMFADGKPWQSLSAESGKSIAATKPVSFFFDLKRLNYDELFEGKNDIPAQAIPAVKKMMANFAHLSAYIDPSESDIELKMTEKKLNSLFRMFQMFDEAYSSSF
ncbi:MAG: DUF4836 family protein [Ferruginibacter sp.]|nr:DUF4836 family protein [Ferruginibacter sp.]